MNSNHCLHFDENFMTVVLLLNGGFCITRHCISLAYILKQAWGLGVLFGSCKHFNDSVIKCFPFITKTLKLNTKI
jgi:hypothetical protein